MKNIQKALALSLLCAIVIPTLFIPKGASACSCMMQTDLNDEALAQAEAVFAGTLVGQVTAAESSNVLTFKASKTWKGPNVQTITLVTPKDSAACGWNPEVGKEYLVYARKLENDTATPGNGRGELGVNLCSRTFLLADAENDLASLGEGRIPVDEAAAPAPADSATASVYYAAGGLLALAIVFGTYKSLRKKGRK